jgi:hypothetical protein
MALHAPRQLAMYKATPLPIALTPAGLAVGRALTGSTTDSAAEAATTWHCARRVRSSAGNGGAWG